MPGGRAQSEPNSARARFLRALCEEEESDQAQAGGDQAELCSDNDIAAARADEEALERESDGTLEQNGIAEVLAEPEEAATPEALLWRAVLDDLALQMTRATFEQWLRGSRLERDEQSGYVVRARNEYGAEWLANRLARQITRTLERYVGEGVAVRFAAALPVPEIDFIGAGEA